MRYYYYSYYPKNSYSGLIDDYNSKKNSMCGIGLKNVKLLLNKMIKQGDSLAVLYRKALELADVNIKAKKYNGDWSDHYYCKKEDLIFGLVKLCENNGDVSYGYSETNDMGSYINAVLYFDISGCEQISFHCHLSEDEMRCLFIVENGMAKSTHR